MNSPLSITEALARIEENVARNALTVGCLHDTASPSATVPDVFVMSFTVPLNDVGCMFLVPVAGRGIFTRAAKLSLNDIYGFIGPAPNERLGVVDVLFTADMQSKSTPQYTGAHLFSDILRGKELQVYCLSEEHTEHQTTTALKYMQFARMTVYDAAIPQGIWNMISPLLYPGARIWLNGADATIAGTGVRHSSAHPSIALLADLFPMQASMLLFDADNTLCANNITIALPLQAVPQAERLLEQATTCVQCPDTALQQLHAAERGLAQAIYSGAFRITDPGVAPCIASSACCDNCIS